MADDLPGEFDLIVVGTGFPESCVAAAASRVGKTVLHIDPNEYYGGAWASFSLEPFIGFLEGGTNQEICNASYKWHISTTEVEPDLEQESNVGSVSNTKEEWTQVTLLQQSRRFNIDLCPKILYSAGPLVQLLISSNICRYAEFRAVDRVCTYYQDEVLNVPCSRSDVFNTKDLNIIEKRLLMKFLNICMAYGEQKREEDGHEYRDKTFREYLQDQKVTGKITTCIMQAIAMCSNETSFEEGMESVKRFLNSLGRYGNTPFLFPMYGCGEIPQCFCRLCAVFGGIYCLKKSVDEISIDADTNCTNVLIAGKTIRARHVVSSHGNIPENLRSSNVGIDGLGTLKSSISRGIFITSTLLGNDEINSGGGGVNLIRLLADTNKEAIFIQLSHYSGTCPKGIFLMHITTPALSDDPVTDLEPFVSQVFNNIKTTAPEILFSAYFTITAQESNNTHVDASTPVLCTSAPYYELDYDRSIADSRRLFNKLYAHDEFLPRAPDPEEIVIDGEDPRALNEISLPDDLRAQLLALEQATEQMDIEDEAAAAGGTLHMDAE